MLLCDGSTKIFDTIVQSTKRGDRTMEYITTKEAAAKWGYSEETIRKWCKKGMFSVVCKAEKKSSRWQIPANAQCPKPLKKK